MLTSHINLRVKWSKVNIDPRKLHDQFIAILEVVIVLYIQQTAYLTI